MSPPGSFEAVLKREHFSSDAQDGSSENQSCCSGLLSLGCAGYKGLEKGVRCALLSKHPGQRRRKWSVRPDLAIRRASRTEM